MTPKNSNDYQAPSFPTSVVREDAIEYGFIGTLQKLKCEYYKTLLCFLQLFIVSNRTNTYYFANNNARHFAFSLDELVNSARLSAGGTELSLVA